MIKNLLECIFEKKKYIYIYIYIRIVLTGMLKKKIYVNKVIFCQIFN